MAAHPYRMAVEVHNAAYRKLGIDYTFVYFGITDAEQGVKAIRALGIRGMNVSMPFKSAVIPYLDRLDPAAEVIGAVNTIDNRDGFLTGYNTDYIGATRVLQEVTSLTGKRRRRVGGGGAARAIAHGLAEGRSRGNPALLFRPQSAEACRRPVVAGYGRQPLAKGLQRRVASPHPGGPDVDSLRRTSL